MSALSTRGVQHTLPVASASSRTLGSGRTGKVEATRTAITPVSTGNARNSKFFELASIPFLALGAVISLFVGMGTASASLAFAGLSLCAKNIVT